jgi:ABC-type lipoprotein release transport system permease subunit
MKTRDIARSGLKGRKRDTLLLKLVITLAFVFIITAMIFQSSTKQTKLEKRLELYGEWNAAYLNGDKGVLDSLEQEPSVKELNNSIIIGDSAKIGVVGTYNHELINMGHLTLYKGDYPKADNEIMVELNQMSNLGLELEVGQKVSVEIDVVTVDENMEKYLNDTFRHIYENSDSDFIQTNSNKYHETPFETMNDILLVASSDYIYAYEVGEVSDPEAIRTKGFLYYQKVTMKKEFVISGILNTYTDKWDLGGHAAPNSFITKSAGDEILDAFYNNSILETSEYEFNNNIFLKLNNIEKFDELKANYPDRYLDNTDNKEYSIYYNYDAYKKETILNEIIENNSILFNLELSNDISSDNKPNGIDDCKVLNLHGINWDMVFTYQSIVDVFNNLNGTPLDNVSKVDNSNFRRNTFSYPYSEGTTENALTIVIIAVIFLATACAVFQIFITQMKRRTRKIVLLKSIGATNGQIIKIILWEGLYLLRSGLLYGVTFGFAISYFAILILNSAKGSGIKFYVSFPLVLLGILAGCVALFVGMIVPMMFAIRIPLLGTMSKPPKHTKMQQHKKNIDIRKMKQSFSTISWNYFKQNKGKTLLPFGLSLLIISILLTTVLLGFMSFKNYINTVIVKNRPDYAIEAVYGEMQKKIGLVEDDLLSIDGVTKVDSYKYGIETLFWYEGMENNKLMNSFKDLLPTKLMSEHFFVDDMAHSNQPEWIRKAFYTKTYGIDSNSEVFSEYEKAITVGSINKEKFDSGEEVILLIPMYLEGDSTTVKERYETYDIVTSANEDNRMEWLLEDSDTYKLSFNKGYKDIAKMQADIKVGDKIKVSSDDEKIVGQEWVISYTTKEVTVGSIVYYFPEEGIWPFSNTVSPYTVITSFDGLEKIYPSSKLGLFRVSIDEMKSMTSSLFKVKYGRTIWYLKTDSDENTVLDSKLLAYANNNGHNLYNYRESNESLWNEGLSSCIVVGLLGLTSSLIALIILYNTLVSKAEQEQNRIGVLQSIGVTELDFTKHYLKVGFSQGMLAVIISNFVLFIIFMVTSVKRLSTVEVSFIDTLKDIFTNQLYLYPWYLHIGICILFLFFILLMNFYSAHKVTKNYPIENIRSLNR